MKINGCVYPESLFYDVEGGTWAKRDGSNYRIGLAPQLNWISGGYTTVTFKLPGTHVSIGKSLGSVEGPRHFDVVRAPFDCTIAFVNEQVRNDPKLINRDPYGAGWFVSVERSGGLSNLLTLSEASELLEARLRQLGVKCFSEFPDREMSEIGVECSAVLVTLSDLLAASPSGTVVHLVTDDPSSDIEMERWRTQTGNLLLDSQREGSLYHFVVKKA